MPFDEAQAKQMDEAAQAAYAELKENLEPPGRPRI